MARSKPRTAPSASVRRGVSTPSSVMRFLAGAFGANPARWHGSCRWPRRRCEMPSRQSGSGRDRARRASSEQPRGRRLPRESWFFRGPLSPTSAVMSSGIATSIHSVFRKSRIEIDASVTRDGRPPCVTSSAAELRGPLLEECLRSFAHVGRRLERAKEACFQYSPSSSIASSPTSTDSSACAIAMGVFLSIVAAMARAAGSSASASTTAFASPTRAASVPSISASPVRRE